MKTETETTTTETFEIEAVCSRTDRVAVFKIKINDDGTDEFAVLTERAYEEADKLAKAKFGHEDFELTEL